MMCVWDFALCSSIGWIQDCSISTICEKIVFIRVVIMHKRKKKKKNSGSLDLA
jgi:hypothetical protein